MEATDFWVVLLRPFLHDSSFLFLLNRLVRGSDQIGKIVKPGVPWCQGRKISGTRLFPCQTFLQDDGLVRLVKVSGRISNGESLQRQTCLKEIL